MGRFSQLAVAASKMAIQDANIHMGVNADPERVGVWIGSGIGGLGELGESFAAFGAMPMCQMVVRLVAKDTESEPQRRSLR